MIDSAVVADDNVVVVAVDAVVAAVVVVAAAAVQSQMECRNFAKSLPLVWRDWIGLENVQKKERKKKDRKVRVRDLPSPP